MRAGVRACARLLLLFPMSRSSLSPIAAAVALLMSTGLTFGTISSLFGLSHGIIDQGRYSALVAAVIASAVIPTVIANAFYLPRHLMPRPGSEKSPADDEVPIQLRQASRKAE